MDAKRPLLGMTLEELEAVAAEVSLPGYAAKQMADWLYKKKITSVAGMTNIAAAKRALLEENYEIGLVPPNEAVRSADGTVKYLYSVGQGNAVESVYIPAENRATLCVSSQAGCKMNCLFCMTGKQGFSKNLTAHEMLNQIQSLIETDELKDTWPTDREQSNNRLADGVKQLTNLVFMGMGEPLDNTDELFKVLEILTASYGYGWSPKRITVSTIGAKGLKRFLEESECHLAISLHSPFPEERLALMPVEKAYPIHEVIEQIRQYDFSHRRRVSFEYIVFKDLNDDMRHAKALIALLKGIPCRVNLIRFHAIPGVPLKSSDSGRMERFQQVLNAAGVICTIRASRGEDIFAACGMLSTAKRADPMSTNRCLSDRRKATEKKAE